MRGEEGGREFVGFQWRDAVRQCLRNCKLGVALYQGNGAACPELPCFSLGFCGILIDADVGRFTVRAQKAVGVVDAAPVYEPLSGFTRYDTFSIGFPLRPFHFLAPPSSDSTCIIAVQSGMCARCFVVLVMEVVKALVERTRYF